MLQEQHPLVVSEAFASVEQYVLYLIHRRAYEEAARLVAGKDVLDLGCNTGYGTAILASRCRSILGVDVSLAALDEARRRFQSPNMRFSKPTGGRIPAPDHSFDVVTSFQVIEHIEDLPSYLGDIRRVLRPDGLVLFTTPNARLRLDPGMRPWNPFHVREFSAEELLSLLSRHFPHVEIRGLMATQTLYRIEHARLSRARTRARVQQSKSRLRRRLEIALRRIAKLRKSKRKRRTPIIPDATRRFGISDLYYVTEDLDAALDLMAICRSIEGADGEHQTIARHPS